MGQIQVDFGQLSSAADHLGQTAKQIESHLHELENTLKPLVSSWTGGAQDAYHQAQQQWDQAAQNLQEITAKMGMAVNAAHDSYQQGEQANTARFGG